MSFIQCHWMTAASSKEVGVSALYSRSLGGFTPSKARSKRPASAGSRAFHDALYLRRLLGLRAAPEFETWLASDDYQRLKSIGQPTALLPA